MSTGPLPNFLVAGAAKCGTTSLFRYLAQHPDVFVPAEKETFHFLAPLYARIPDADPHGAVIRGRTVADGAAYAALFAGAGGCRAVGEVATFYAYHHDTAIPAIRRELGDARILLVLRHPVERAYSAWNHFRGYGLEPLDFEGGLAAESRRRAEGWYSMWHYAAAGRYAGQVRAFRAAFPEVLVLLQDDLLHGAADAMRRVFAFLGVDDRFRPDVTLKYMVSGRPRRPWLGPAAAAARRAARPLLHRVTTPEQRYRALSWVRMRGLHKPAMAPATRAALLERFTPDVDALERELERDLSAWRT